MPDNNQKFESLLSDLRQLETYLHDRGDRSQNLSQRFAENAKQDPGNREFDLNQSRMLDYQHHIWHEIANLVEKLVKQYE